MAADIALPSHAIEALAILEASGFESWVVGGFVRDSLLGRPAADVDLACSCPPEATMRCFEAAGWDVHATGIAHGTVTVVRDHRAIEVTTYRADGTYSDARHPDSVTFVSSIEEDLARRDFTMNAIAYHPDRGILDPFGGQADLDAGIIRVIGDGDARFKEDALRLLRGCRFASQLGFAIEEETYAAMQRNRGLLEHVAAERIAHELTQLLLGDDACNAILRYAGILGVVLPEILPCQGFEQHTPYHIYDVLEHTAHAVQSIPATPILRWTALLHDLGKPSCFFTGDDGVGHFYGHPGVSAQIAADVMKRLKIRRDDADRIIMLVRFHDAKIPATPKAVRRWIVKLGGDPEALRQLLAMKRADAAAQAPRCAVKIDEADAVEAVLDEELSHQAVFCVEDLAISGRDLIGIEIEPGPHMGALLADALEAYLDGRVQNEPEALLAYLSESIASSTPTA